MRGALILVFVASSALADVGTFELLAHPAQVQINGAFSQHVGVGLGFAWHPTETFAVQVSGFFNRISVESKFSDELINKVRFEASSSKALLNTWGALMTVEVTPFQGSLGSKVVRFSAGLFGGAGVGGTKHQLKPENTSGPATFGDTGVRPLVALGAGFRIQYGKHFTVRLEVRDLVYSGRIESVNGCSAADLAALNRAQYSGRLDALSNACDLGTFAGKRENDVPLANNLTKSPTNELVQNIGLQLGVGFVF